MLILRMATGITAHFPARVSEWHHSLALAIFGLILLHPGTTFGNGPSYVLLSRVMSEHSWGWLCFAAGFARLTALAVNGAFRRTPYAVISPWVRAIGALVGCFFWFTISISFLVALIVADPARGISTAFSAYPLFFVFDLTNVYRAMHDVGKVEARALAAKA